MARVFMRLENRCRTIGVAAWSNPPQGDRPLQIAHGIALSNVPAEVEHYKDLHLGGVVCNVPGKDYLRSEANWKSLVRAVDCLAKLGMTVWIYDENGYPSGAAGGEVLKENRQFEAQELAFDASKPDPFVLRPAFEFTHASNNYAAVQRYINLIDDRAVQCFLAKTHDAYYKWLGPHFGKTITATFTDEPSLIAVNLGGLNCKRIVDPIDPKVRALPAVPWCYDLTDRFKERYHCDLMPLRRSLFTGNSTNDRLVRRQFWSLIADLVAERYFGAIQTWCKNHRVASSGHTLWEECALHHVPLEGNALKSLGRMDIPGLDLLSSDPAYFNESVWVTAAFPASAAMWNGRRRVMTEVSDFCQTMAGQKPVGLSEMQATAAWQATWGVTDFTLYYTPQGRSPESYRAYCDFVGRLNAVLKPAERTPKTLLYYPIYDLWAEYLPVAEPLGVQSQSPRAQRLVSSFTQLGRALQESQIPFSLVDHENLGRAKLASNGMLEIAGHRFDTLVLPNDVELPADVARIVEQFRRQGGRVVAGLWDATRMATPALISALQPSERIEPASKTIAIGQFTRDGRNITLIVNIGRESYDGVLRTSQKVGGQLLRPADGSTRRAKMQPSGALELKLAPRESVLLVQ